MGDSVTRVSTPQFEVVGPPCQDSECSGVLVDHLDLRTKHFFKRCSKCGSEFGRMLAADKLAWVRRVIERTLKGEKES